MQPLKYKPLNKRVIVTPKSKPEDSGALITNSSNLKQGLVRAVSDDSALTVGCTVLYKESDSIDTDIDGDVYHILSERDLIMVSAPLSGEITTASTQSTTT